MKSLLIALLWRLGLGILIAIIGIVLSVALGNLNIEYTWFSILGFVCILLAALPFTPGARGGEFVSTYMTSGTQFTEVNKRTLSSTANFSVTMALVGVVNLLAPVITYYVTR